jgi:hypothetical protein
MMMRRKQALKMCGAVCTGAGAVFIRMPASDSSKESDSGGQQWLLQQSGGQSWFESGVPGGCFPIDEWERLSSDTLTMPLLAASSAFYNGLAASLGLKVVFQVDALLSMNETVCHQTRH